MQSSFIRKFQLDLCKKICRADRVRIFISNILLFHILIFHRQKKWSPRKVSSYLVRVKLYQLHRKVGSKKCAKNRCEICDYVTDTDTFISTVSGESFKINHQLNCDDICLIYLLTCKQCHKQYTGETTDDFRYRWNSYNSSSRKFDRKEPCMQEHPYKHFSSPGHMRFLNDVSLTLIDKTDGSGPKKREDYWMKTLKSMAPCGLHIEDSV